MSTTLNNFIKYNFTIRTFIQVLYEFRTRKTLDLLRIDDFDSIISKTRNVTITAYSVIIKSVIVENDFSASRISLFRIVIFIKSSIFVKKLTSRQAVTFMKTIKSPISVKTSTAKEIPFIETFNIVIMNEYRSSYIDIKNAIAFISLKIKKAYNARH